MPQIDLEFQLEKPFKNLTRSKTVNIIIKDSQDRYILGTKLGYYPKGIYRLLGGGVEEGEDPKSTAIRELQEEIKVEVQENQLVQVAELNIRATDKDNKQYQTTIELFLVTVPIDSYETST